MLKKILITLFSRGVGAISAFLLSVLLGQYLGAEESGRFFLLLTLLMFVGCIAGLGFEQSLIKYVGICNDSGEHAKSRKILFFSLKSVSVPILIFIIVILALAKPMSERLLGLSTINHFVVLSLCIAPYVLLRVFGGYFKGVQRPGLGAFWDQGAYYFFTLIGVIICKPFFHLNSYTVLIILFTCLIVQAVVSFMFLPVKKVDFNEATIIEPQKLLSSSCWMMLILFIYLSTNLLSSILLGYFTTPFEVGVFNAASKLSILVPFLLLAINVVIGPKFASLYSQNKIDQLRSLYLKSLLVVTVIAIPISLVLIKYATFFLSLFGGEFIVGSDELKILVVGQCINACTGAVGYLMIMTGSEKIVFYFGLFAFIFNIILCYCLIPIYGAVGAAVASTLCIVLLNIGNLFYINLKFDMFDFVVTKCLQRSKT